MSDIITVSKTPGGMYALTIIETYSHDKNEVSRTESWIVDDNHVKSLFNQCGQELQR